MHWPSPICVWRQIHRSCYLLCSSWPKMHPGCWRIRWGAGQDGNDSGKMRGVCPLIQQPLSIPKSSGSLQWTSRPAPAPPDGLSFECEQGFFPSLWTFPASSLTQWWGAASLILGGCSRFGGRKCTKYDASVHGRTDWTGDVSVQRGRSILWDIEFG